jgi:hemerythrin-like domain-containing protein
MKMEHEQMRGLIANIGGLVTAKDKDEVLGEAETLLILMQQHNMKEEQILYPMIGAAAEVCIEEVQI